MTKTLFSLALLAAVTDCYAAPCSHGVPVQVVGDAPGAISYDVFSHLYPLNVETLARMTAAKQVVMIPDGTVTCTITDDGVPNPDAVLIAGPHAQMNYWLSSAAVRPLR